MRVLVIGGGVAGTATALGLREAGIAATICEAHPSSTADGGAFLTLADNGVHALRQLGAEAVVAAASEPLRTMSVNTVAGAEITSRPLGDGGTAFRYLTRARLCQALQEEAQRRGIEIVRGKRLRGVTRHAHGLTASFADASSVGADVLIGADGVWSTVRSILDPAAPSPRYVGQRVFYGYATGAGVPGPPDRIHFVRGAAAFGYVVTAQDETWWFARVHDTELDPAQLAAGTTATWRAQLLDLLADEPVPAAIVRAADRVLVTNAYDLADVATWHRDGMLIIGDAAHPASPATGQGASMALEDAVVLAAALRDEPDSTAAFTSYERLRRDRVLDNVAASARLSAPPEHRGS